MKNIFVYVRWNAIVVFCLYASVEIIPLNEVDFYICDIYYFTNHILQMGSYLKK